MHSLKRTAVGCTALVVLVGGISALTSRAGFAQGNFGTTNAPPPFAVTVVNTPLPVRNVEAAVHHPFQESLVPSTVDEFQAASFTVPAGKRLVIEFASGRIQMPQTCTIFDAEVRTTAQGVTKTHVLKGDVNFTGLRFVSVSEETRLYADAGTDVSLFLDWVGANCHQNIGFITFSGHLVDVG